jgi:putative peptidoglycan lipid II flippase
VQLSSYVDLVLASLLAIGAVARLRYAQTLYVLPVSLFGASAAAAELPELARERAGTPEALRARASAAVRRVSFFVVPSFVAFVLLGDVLVAGLYRTGKFGSADVSVVWITLIAYSFGLLASTTTRVYQSTFFALRDTKTPARVAALRVVAAAVAGALLMLQFEPLTVAGRTFSAGYLARFSAGGVPLGPVGLALGAAIGAWLEWTLLRVSLAKRIGPCSAGAGALARMFGAALVAAGLARLVPWAVHWSALPLALLAASVYGAAYFAAARALGLDEARIVIATLMRHMR